MRARVGKRSVLGWNKSLGIIVAIHFNTTVVRSGIKVKGELGNFQASQKRLCCVDWIWNLQWQCYSIHAVALWYQKGISSPGVYTWIWSHEFWIPSWISTMRRGWKYDQQKKINPINERTGIQNILTPLVDAIQPPRSTIGHNVPIKIDWEGDITYEVVRD